ncbi:MAG: peptidylprolyl isomerase [Amphritea sp.]
MMVIAKIDNEVITSDDFVKILKIKDTYEEHIEALLSDKLTVHAAKKHGLVVSDEEVQERADQFRRIQGLHRAKDTLDYLNDLGITIDEFEIYLSEALLKQKVVAEICSDDAINEYFRLNSPKFDVVEMRHIVVDAESKARELYALLEDEPEMFAELAHEHSLSADTAKEGGALGRLRRGTLPDEINAKAFNASRGEVLGPFASDDGLLYEIFQVEAFHPATLDDVTAREVHKLIYRQWLESRAQEHVIDVL